LALAVVGRRRFDGGRWYERRRVEAGALLYTAARLAVLATFLNYQVAGVWFPTDQTSWRYVFCSAFCSRRGVPGPPVCQNQALAGSARTQQVKLREMVIGPCCALHSETNLWRFALVAGGAAMPSCQLSHRSGSRRGDGTD
jgi:hypothetical protein